MAATDQTHRNQRTLDIVFAVSCVGMLFSLFWMFYQDYNREFKTVQRQFRDVEVVLNENQMLDQLPDPDLVREHQAEVRQKRKDLDKLRNSPEIQKAEQTYRARRDTDMARYQRIKADLDARQSYYDIAVEHRGHSESPAEQARLDRQIEKYRNEVDKLKEELAAAQKVIDENERTYKENVTDKLADAQKNVTDAEDELKKQTSAFDRFAKTTAQKTWKFGDTFRNWPILDAFNPPTKINQITLPDLTIDYGGFKDVPRYDRCTSCHLAIDRKTFDRESLMASCEAPTLTAAQAKKRVDQLVKMQKIPNPESEEARAKAEYEATQNPASELTAGLRQQRQVKLDLSREILERRQRAGEKLGFDLSDLPTKVRTVKLTRGQVVEYSAHPRLDLFVDSNSPHPMEKFGCTICHAGQGSATDFQFADHTPADTRQEEEWKKEYGWHSSHFWDFPMLSSRFVESSCLKCHHQVTDLIRDGSKEEAPKLLQGYNLVRENGCFGCHEIAGIKGAREVGPDMRLEPTPALDYLTPAEQDKAKADPTNPPGTYRKVGPGLRRIAEKTNQKWAREWIQAPRDFREDTKMPHFYNLSNNNPAYLRQQDEENERNNKDKKEVDRQQDFPAAEIHSISYYLFTESKKHLQGEDTTREILKKKLAELHEKLLQQDEGKIAPLSDKDKKELDVIWRQLTDLALLSVPANAREINVDANNLKQLQDQLQELFLKRQVLLDRKDKIQRKPVRNAIDADALEAIDNELKELKPDKLQPIYKKIEEAKNKLIEAGKPTPIAKQILHWNGSVVPDKDIPAPDEKRRANGEKLFKERGCLACHVHEGTTKGDLAVSGDANFAPNLSRIADKLGPEVGGADGKRRWLIQWLLNPNIHHPRTRMPITQLEVPDACDIADWLLSQTTGWQGKDPAEPSVQTLVALARLYVAKAPAMTRADLDNYLPTDTEKLPGLSKEYVDTLAHDADERQLVGEVDQDKLKWYIGKKSIGRLGCYGCHDVPGFEAAKPVGVALNDWGKKDPERLAFEDSVAYAKEHFNIVPARDNAIDKTKADPKWKSEDGKPPYEKYFFEALEHHTRQGFLHLKLEDPRSFDYNRRRTWDDRLRMPQFQFARTHQKKGESDEAYAIRKEKEESEGREAVMTFILGLVADPISLKHVYNPKPDKLAEIKGRQVLDKFNCGGCHQIRSGVYEFKQSPDTLRSLEDLYRDKAAEMAKSHSFMDHNAWVGTASPYPDLLIAHGTDPRLVQEDENSPEVLQVRLSDALRFTNRESIQRDLPAGSIIKVPKSDVIPPPGDANGRQLAQPYGGTFSYLLIDYLKKSQSQDVKDNDLARNRLPPPLIREGERVQPNWLYQFLQKPHLIRPLTVLRMPQFNMSPEEAMTIVNYFTAVERLSNPIAGTTDFFVTVPQREEDFWQKRNAEYIKRLNPDEPGLKPADREKRQEMLKKRFDQMKPVWDQMRKEQIETAKEELATAEEALKQVPKEANQEEKDRVTRERDNAKARLDKLEKSQKDKVYKDLEDEWKDKDAYAADGYRLLLTHANRICLSCHTVGNQGSKQAPALDKVYERLRPEWTRRWLSNPQRMYSYNTIMPVNFPKGDIQSQDLFDGNSSEQIMAIRDVLLNYPRIANLPVNRSYKPPATSGGK